ncbi:MAG TPA: trypsin-like peptidase domain-containing protein [Saprospiraceae bacterium]|jgi:protease Do-like 1, chloroplastic
MKQSVLGLNLIIVVFISGILVQCKPDQVAASQLKPTEEPVESAVSRPIDSVRVISNSEEVTISLFEEAAPSVVYITTTTVRQDYWSTNLYEIPAGTGSGFIWDDEGHIVTNFHVIRDAYKAKVTLSDQTTWDAEIIGREPRKDLAVLKIDSKANLKPIRIGTSHDLRVGQSVLAIGNPFGLDQTLTTGIISALGREIESVAQVPIRDVIQTDAAINPGNSGGPLLDISGRLIGVNTAIYSPSGAYAGIGFSVPVDVVNWVVPDLIKYGAVKRPVLGIELVQQQSIDKMDLKGALVLNVTPGGAAEKGGVQPTRRSMTGDLVMGDLIIEVNDEPVESNNDLLLTLEKYQPGQEVRLKVKRNKQTTTLTITLGSSL